MSCCLQCIKISNEFKITYFCNEHELPVKNPKNYICTSFDNGFLNRILNKINKGKKN
jgi:hypothetical protein